MSNGHGLHIAGRAHLFTETRGCLCGSLVVATSEDAREVRNIVSKWEGLHPEGRALGGEMHGRCTIAEAKARQARRDVPAERSRIELRRR